MSSGTTTTLSAMRKEDFCFGSRPSNGRGEDVDRNTHDRTCAQHQSFVNCQIGHLAFML